MPESLPNRPAFIGRAEELAIVEGCARQAEAGDTQIIWIEGEAGLGKSVLAQRIVDDLTGRFVLVRAFAEEVSGDSSYSTLSQLGVTTSASPFAAGLALVEHLSSLQETRPVLVVVEDFHWADAASRSALLLAARRMQHDRVAMVITTRHVAIDDEWSRVSSDPSACVNLTLGGLSDTEIAALARDGGVELSLDQAARLGRHTMGHPLYVHTLLRELTADQLRSESAELPAPRSLAMSTVAALAALPPDSRDLAAALAVFGRPTPLAVVGEIAEVDEPSVALEPLLRSGLVSWSASADRTPVGFSHPLLRAAVYDDLAPERRRDLHRACAAVTRWGPSWAHRLAASEGPDETLTTELVGGADYEIARRDPALAATYLTWAAAVAPTRERAERLLLAAVRLFIHDGQTARAASFRSRLVEFEPTALRQLVLGMLAFAEADAESAERSLLDVAAVEPPTDSNRSERAEADTQLGLLYTLQGRAAEMVEHGRRALDVGFAETWIERNAWWVIAIGEASLHGARHGLTVLTERLPEPAPQVPGTDAELLVVRGLLHVAAGDTRAAIEDLRTAFELARAGYGFAQLPRAHLMLARALYWRGDWDESLVQARTAQSLLDQRPWMPTQPESSMTLVLAARGEWESAERNVSEAMALAEHVRTIELVTAARCAAAALAHAQGRHDEVVAVLRPLAGIATADATPLTMVGWWPMLAGSLVASGDLDAAGVEIGRIEVAADRYELEFGVHIADLRGRLALALGDSETAATLLHSAVDGLQPDHPILDRALLHHALGGVLRARGEQRRGEDQLRLSHGILDGLGATPYRQRVEDDLRASGSASRPRRSRQPFALTNRELDVATLVKKGMTNKEVAAELYISAKSVEFHLRNVYAKLMVSSRRDLRDLELTDGER